MKLNRILIISLIIALGLAGGLVLVNRNQDTRNKAAGESNIISIVPTEIKGSVDEVKTVGILINSPAKISTAKVKLCYGSALSLSESDIKDIGPLSQTNYKTIKDNCVIISKHIDNSLTKDQWPSGAIQFANIDFKIKGNGNLEVVKADSILAGDLNGSPTVEITSAGTATVTVDGSTSTNNDGTISLESSDLTNKKVGENINVNLYLDSNKNYSSVDFKLCYGDKVTLSNSDAKKGDDFSEGIVSNNSGNCLTYTAVKTGSEITGKKKVASLKFVASQSGSGSFEVSQSSTKFSGESGGQVVAYKINSVSSLGYSVGGAVTGQCNRCSNNYGCTRATFTGADSSCTNPVGTVTYTQDATCPKISDSVLATLGESGSNNTCNGVVQVGSVKCNRCSNNYGCMRATFSSSEGSCINPIGAVTYTQDNSCPKISDTVLAELGDSGSNSNCNGVSNANLKFEVAFAGVKPGAKCIDSFLQKVKINFANRLTGTNQNTETSASIVSSKSNASGDQVFLISASGLSGNASDNVLRVKGYKHGQMRYCTNNQKTKVSSDSPCDISLNSSNTYNFADYSILPGDLDKNGAINGVDYSLLKSNIDDLTKVEPDCNRENVKTADLDGNGVVNGNDITLFKNSIGYRDDE